MFFKFLNVLHTSAAVDPFSLIMIFIKLVTFMSREDMGMKMPNILIPGGLVMLPC